ncbi:sensor histidine kinase N-terminal domain-containing protein [Marinobacterium sp. AK62]|uniref:histidine kinase n=1 Tax=Marinobacterium alkalitolerans TaxID=1542925 RepID=A0ABS3Z7L0_9GAMM|nr:ATP-binding protein [Marinobacterium alkalitolerans]MBP0047697.1 sensor histidine kinase N-terminal domain-containing protein [Marinobacterium alkalitolerans]
MTSIRRALSLSLISAGLCAGLVTAWLSFYAAKDEAEELFDAQMAQMARLVAQLVPRENSHQPIAPHSAQWQPAHPYEKQLAYRVLDSSGEPLIVSPSFPAQVTEQAPSGYREMTFDGTRWRLFTLAVPSGEYRIQVIQDDHIRRELAIKIALTNTLPILVFLPLLGLVIWWLIGHHLRPLLTLGREVSTRSSENLEPFELDPIPDEVDALVSALNALLLRLQKSFERERRFTADAAHELRTPLAALQIHCENLFQQLQDEDARSDCTRILNGLANMNRMVHQLLQLSRLDPQERLSDTEAVSLNQLCEEAISDQIGFAIERDIDLGLVAPEDNLSVNGNALYLGIMLRNLIDNALRYTPTGGEVTLSLERQADHICLNLTDSGPGLSQVEKSRVFERFYRQSQHTSGSGLGLSIVRLIADLHEARVQLRDREDGLNGLVVRVEMPSVTASGSD